MNREQLLHQLRAVNQSVLDLFALTPIHRLDFSPAKGVRTLLDLGNHFAAVPLVDLAALQGNPRQVTEAIEETLHGAGPNDWIDIFGRGVRATAEFFENMSEEEFETKISRAHHGSANPQAVWLFEMITHIYHHRGQFYAYLRMLKVPVDVEHLYI
jgi:uncharacterized damage-inducible protein DinB